MAVDAKGTPRTLCDASRIRARPSDFGADLERLFSVPTEGSVAKTLAWGGSVFRREVDGRLEDDLDVHSLLKRGSDHLDGRRVRAARLAAAKLVKSVERLRELGELAAEWNDGNDNRVLVWSSLVGLKTPLFEQNFRVLVRPTHGELLAAVGAAWTSAYELSLLEELAERAVRRFSLAVALSFLPSYRSEGELFWSTGAKDQGANPWGVARLRDDENRRPWFELSAGPQPALSAHEPGLPGNTETLVMALPPGRWHAEFGVGPNALYLTRLRHAPAPDPKTARWVALDGDLDTAWTEFERSLLAHFERRVARPLLDELGVRTRRQSHWLTTHRGRPYLNLAILPSLAETLDANPVLLTALAGGPLEPIRTHREQRFRAPRLLAQLALLDTQLRARVREFQVQSLRHTRWFEELDLAILPDDALPTTLRETREFVDGAGRLFVETALALVRALSSLAELGSNGQALELSHVFPTLIADDELASLAQCDDFDAALSAVHAEAATLAALRAGARCLVDLPEGRAKRELSYYLRQYGFWTTAREVGSRRLEDDVGTWLETLLLVRPLPTPERAARKRAALALRDTATRLLAGNNGWLGRQALNTMLERVLSFARMHETLRVALARHDSLLRQALIDAGRRLARSNPGLAKDAVWHLSFDELVSAVQYGDSNLAALVDERARCHRRRLDEATPGRLLHDLTNAPSAPTLASHLHGAPTATGQFMGRVRKLSLLSKERPLGSNEVLVGWSLNAAKTQLIGHVGAIASAVGGPLSHAAFVARQLGVPAVVGVGEAIETLREGDEVLVDGNEGVLLRTAGGLARP